MVKNLSLLTNLRSHDPMFFNYFKLINIEKLPPKIQEVIYAQNHKGLEVIYSNSKVGPTKFTNILLGCGTSIGILVTLLSISMIVEDFDVGTMIFVIPVILVAGLILTILTLLLRKKLEKLIDYKEQKLLYAILDKDMIVLRYGPKVRVLPFKYIFRMRKISGNRDFSPDNPDKTNSSLKVIEYQLPGNSRRFLFIGREFDTVAFSRFYEYYRRYYHGYIRS